jgi:flap endonuclease-1
MGLQFKDLVVREEISARNLKDKILAVDSMNLLYQFLTTIRGMDGSALTDSKGRVTSHLIGLFSRTTSLMEQGLKLVFVFDGKAPDIKKKTWEKRTAIKQEAAKLFQKAEEEQNLGDMRKFASRTVILDKDMIRDAKNVITALGLPIVQAPSEGEAQTAYMVKNGTCYASVSQDYDNLIFGCPTLVRNLSIDGKRKRAGKFAYQKVSPEMIKLDDVLKKLELNLEQLIVLAILVGTDYNPGGVKGIGPKTALKLMKEHGDNFDKIFEEVKWKEFYPDLEWQEVFDTIKHIPVTDDYKLEWKNIDEEALIHLLVEEHGFSLERVKSKLEKLNGVKDKLSQKGLSSFF